MATNGSTGARLPVIAAVVISVFLLTQIALLHFFTSPDLSGGDPKNENGDNNNVRVVKEIVTVYITPDGQEQQPRPPEWPQIIIQQSGGEQQVIDDAKREENLPPIVKAFRKGHIDWHDLIPGDISTHGKDIEKLIKKEMAVAQFLISPQRDFAKVYGMDYGDLIDSQACVVLNDKCQVHRNKATCLQEPFCGWCAEIGLCMDRTEDDRGVSFRQYSKEGCPSKLEFEAYMPFADGDVRHVLGNFDPDSGRKTSSLLPVRDKSQCLHNFTTHAVLRLRLNTNSLMYYHWISEIFEPLTVELRARGDNSRTKNNLLLIEDDPADPHRRQRNGDEGEVKIEWYDIWAEYLWAVSHTCYRLIKDLPPFTCVLGHEYIHPRYYKGLMGESDGAFPDDPRGVHPRAPGKPNVPEVPVPKDDIIFQPKDPYIRTLLMDAAGIANAGRDPPTEVQISIITRGRKRFLLNEHEMVVTARSLGVKVALLPLEEMTLYEQLYEFSRTTILVGIHGSGLSNGLYLPKGGVLLQINTYGLEPFGEAFFSGVVSGVEGVYMEWTPKAEELSRPHWHFKFENLDKPHSSLANLATGIHANSADFFNFWVNQDIRVPRDAFLAVLKSAMKSGINNELRRYKNKEALL